MEERVWGYHPTFSSPSPPILLCISKGLLRCSNRNRHRHSPQVLPYLHELRRGGHGLLLISASCFTHHSRTPRLAADSGVNWKIGPTSLPLETASQPRPRGGFHGWIHGFGAHKGRPGMGMTVA
jgi:hypothetical protein